MRITEVSIKGLGPIKNFHERFKLHNMIIGPCGIGKTTLLHALGGVCGSDKATELVRNLEVEHFVLHVEHDGERFVFECEGRFDEEKIVAFKQQLPVRASIPVTERGRSYITDVLPAARVRRTLWAYTEGRNDLKRSCNARIDNRLGLPHGDGISMLMYLLINESPDEVPMIMDVVGHLDMLNKRYLSDHLVSSDRQLFWVVHDPEYLGDYERSGVKIVELTNKSS